MARSGTQGWNLRGTAAKTENGQDTAVEGMGEKREENQGGKIGFPSF
jgi:hypothetical protein